MFFKILCSPPKSMQNKPYKSMQLSTSITVNSELYKNSSKYILQVPRTGHEKVKPYGSPFQIDCIEIEWKANQREQSRIEWNEKDEEREKL